MENPISWVQCSLTETNAGKFATKNGMQCRVQTTALQGGVEIIFTYAISVAAIALMSFQWTTVDSKMTLHKLRRVV